MVFLALAATVNAEFVEHWLAYDMREAEPWQFRQAELVPGFGRPLIPQTVRDIDASPPKSTARQEPEQESAFSKD